jgi:hypothetical protein
MQQFVGCFAYGLGILNKAGVTVTDTFFCVELKKFVY